MNMLCICQKLTKKFDISVYASILEKFFICRHTLAKSSRCASTIGTIALIDLDLSVLWTVIRKH